MFLTPTTWRIALKTSKNERRPIPGHLYYHCSSDGKVWEDWDDDGGGRQIKPHKQGLALFVNLNQTDGKTKMRKTKSSVARLMALAWHGVPPDGSVARHRDGNPKNNHADNIYWDVPQVIVYNDDDPEESFPIFPDVDDYWITRDGVVWNAKTSRSLKVTLRGGVPTVNLVIDGKATTRTVASLACLCWCGPKPGEFADRQVWASHKNGNRMDNSKGNVYWRTPQKP